MNKAQLSDFIRFSYRSNYGDDRSNGGTCLYWCYVTCVALRVAGYRALLQAGTMDWLINRTPGPDDPTHFTYQWDPQSQLSQERMEAGALPEVHCWVAVPDLNWIIDFSTGGFKRLAMQRHKLKWTEADPPEFLWCHCRELPQGVRYAPNYDAIKYVLEFLTEKEAIANIPRLSVPV